MRYTWILLLVVLIPTSLSAATILHEGATNPAEEGWYLMSGISGGPDETTEPSWRIATSGHGRWGPLSLGEENFTGEWTAFVRAKWNDGVPAQQRMTIFDGYRAKSTAFTWGPDGVYYYRKGFGDTLIPDTAPDGQFHDMAVVMEEETSDMVFVYDGLIVDRLTPDQQNDTNPGFYLFYWGDNQGEAGFSDMQYAMVSLSNEVIPEPSTWLMLLTTMGFGLWWWRRW
ncbi:MAG: PEP-CTERM sorting domain-containing protein [Planctomycetota bacterium]|jgi:hypothetical protein